MIATHEDSCFRWYFRFYSMFCYFVIAKNESNSIIASHQHNIRGFCISPPTVLQNAECLFFGLVRKHALINHWYCGIIGWTWGMLVDEWNWTNRWKLLNITLNAQVYNLYIQELRTTNSLNLPLCMRCTCHVRHYNLFHTLANFYVTSC